MCLGMHAEAQSYKINSTVQPEPVEKIRHWPGRLTKCDMILCLYKYGVWGVLLLKLTFYIHCKFQGCFNCPVVVSVVKQTVVIMGSEQSQKYSDIVRSGSPKGCSASYWYTA